MRRARCGIRLFDPFKHVQLLRPWTHLYLNVICAFLFFVFAAPSLYPTEYYHYWALHLSSFPQLNAWRSKPGFALEVHLRQNLNSTTYEYRGQPLTLEEFDAQLAGDTAASSNLRVRVSYEPDVPYQSYINVLDECRRQQIGDCEMVTLDSAEPLSK